MKEQGIFYRKAGMGDIDKLFNLEAEVWGMDMAASQDKWISRIIIFSEGVNIAEENGKIIGVIVNHIVDWKYPAGYHPTWVEVTDNGF